MTTKQRSPLVILFLTVFLDLLGFGLIIPSLGVYARQLAQDANISQPIFAATSLGFIYSIMQFVFTPLWGRLSDRIGRRPVLLISIAGSAVGFLGIGFAQSFWWLLFARAFAGIMTSNLSVAQAYIADVTTQENRSRSMGLIGIAFGLGFVLGPFVGGELSGAYGTAAPSFFAAGLAALNFMWAMFALPESRKPNQSPRPKTSRVEMFRREILQSPQLSSLMLVSFLAIFAFANLEQTFGLMLQAKFNISSEAEAGQLTGRYLGFAGLLGAFLQGGLLGRLVKKFGEPRLIVFGFFTTALGMFLVSSLDGRTLLLLPMALVAIGQGAYTPSVSGLLSRLSDPERQGEILGVAQSANSLGRILGPAWGGMVFQHLGYHAPYVSGAVVLIIAGILGLRFKQRWSTAPTSIPALAT
jgi:MFS transporter, DHA1 family, tetracycline resistance protein